MKKILILLAAVFFAANLFAHTGIMNGQKEIKIAKTKYFDIIYAEKSERTADILVEKGDAVYEELAEQLGLKHSFRLPVVISPAQDDFNAYFSCGPFNHIVMYDTVCTTSIAVFTEEFLMTFRHELTHAITYNLRNSFWFGLDKVLGDVYNPALLTITTAWAEGATVSIESENGEGRVNDPYSTQMVKQAKIEGCFPKYSSVQGARDVYPTTTESYMFGGMFNFWLQNKYGMEKYAQFWWRCVNLKSITYFGAFKKVYGVSIKSAWKEFFDSIEVPEIPADPEENQYCSIFKGGKKLSQYTCLTSWENGFAFYDAYSRSIKYSDGRKVKTLHKQPDVEAMSFSKDGRFIAETYSSQVKMVPKNRVRIYDMQNHSFYYAGEESLRDAAVICSENRYFLAAVKTESSFCSIKLYGINLNGKNRISGLNLIYEEKFDSSKQIFSLEGDLAGNVFYILKNGLNYSICSFNVETKETTEWTLPEQGIVLQDLNVSVKQENSEDEEIYFSFAKKGTLPRIGLLKPLTADFNLSETDSSGGMYTPVSTSGETFYTAKFFKGSKIYKVDLNSLEFIQMKSPEVHKISEKHAETDTAHEKTEISSAGKKFSPFAYTFTGPHGTFLPLGIDNSYKPKSLNSLETKTALLGLTYVSSTPWTNPIWYVTGGYDFQNKCEGASIGVQGGSLTDVFTYTALAHVGFDTEGFKQNYDNLTLSSKIPLLGVTYLKFSESGFFIADKDYLWTKNVAGVTLGNIHRSGYGYFDYSGIQFTAEFENDYYGLTENFKYYNDYYNFDFDLMWKNSLLIPVTVEGMLFPNDSYLASAVVKLVLFNKEIQGSTNFLPLFYANRIALSTYYLAKCGERIDSWAINGLWDYLKESKKSYYDELAVTLDVYLTPNLGGLARPAFEGALSGTLKYHFFPEENQSCLQYSLGIKTSF